MFTVCIIVSLFIILIHKMLQLNECTVKQPLYLMFYCILLGFPICTKSVLSVQFINHTPSIQGTSSMENKPFTFGGIYHLFSTIIFSSDTFNKNVSTAE